jgi:hypothetical protein
MQRFTCWHQSNYGRLVFQMQEFSWWYTQQTQGLTMRARTSEDAIWDLQEIDFMGMMSKNTPIKLILSITLCIDRDQINFIDKK